jgi:hypothetical protein
LIKEKDLVDPLVRPCRTHWRAMNAGSAVAQYEIRYELPLADRRPQTTSASRTTCKLEIAYIDNGPLLSDL